MSLYKLLRKFLFMLDPEQAHALSLLSLGILHKFGLVDVFVGGGAFNPASKPTNVMGIDFPNPVGLAAGLDKNGDYIDALAACGFGFVEVGTVTPEPQKGNPNPRLFRLVDDQAIINRMGFNNKGVNHLVEQVKGGSKHCVLGINIGKNRETSLEEAVNDYKYALAHVYLYADYVTINISSPNTPGLRDLQYGDELEKLLNALKKEQSRLHAVHARYVPLVVKIAPDLNENEINELAEAFIKYKIDGVIATNTTNERPNLIDKVLSSEEGGLSGRPLSEKSDHVLERLSDRLNGKIPIIAVGGIMTREDAKRKMQLGASLVQLYTGFIYEGPSLIHDCVKSISYSKSIT
jgi:dihydroorotate dehydrogenase